MNNFEYEKIYQYITNIAREVRITFNRNNKLMLTQELLEWLQNNGGYVLIKEDKKKLKTKDKVIRTYITKWGIKFQIIEDYKYYCLHYVEIKVLTRM